MGKKLLYVPQCHSTNTTANELLNKEELPDGTLIITGDQTKGRGQRGNVWESESGSNLTFTVVLKPLFLQPKDQFHLNIVISLGITDYLNNLFHRTALIKWPNDILFNLKKVGGILIENQISGNRLTTSLVGIGLNVNQEKFSSPRAASLRTFSGVSFSLDKELEDLLSYVESRYLQLKSGNSKVLMDIYLERLFGFDEWRTYRMDEATLEGKIIGVDDAGKLIIETKLGRRSFDLKEIEFIY